MADFFHGIWTAVHAACWLVKSFLVLVACGLQAELAMLVAVLAIVPAFIYNNARRVVTREQTEVEKLFDVEQLRRVHQQR